MKNLLHSILVVALLLAHISPACAFISGQSLSMEICTAEGIKIIEIADGQSNEKQSKHQEAKQDCAFCFAQSNLKTLNTAHNTLSIVAFSKSISKSEQNTQIQKIISAFYIARAPPSFV